MFSENDERVKIFWELSLGNFTAKMMDVKGLKDEVKKLNAMPFHLGSFILSNWKRIMNIFVHGNNGFYTNDV